MSIWSSIKNAYNSVASALKKKPVTPSPVPAGQVGTPTTTSVKQPTVTTTPTTGPAKPTVTTTPTTTATVPKTTTTTSSGGGGGSSAPVAQPPAQQSQSAPSVQPQDQLQGQSQTAQVSTSSSTSSTPTTTPQSQYREAPVKNRDGTVSMQWIDKNKSYIGQTGQYEFDFWSSEGQAERLKNALETASIRTTATSFGGNYVPVASEATTVLIDALNVAAIVNAGASVFNWIKGATAVGEIAVTAGGAQQLASTIPQASAIVPKVAAVGEVVANTKNAATSTNFITTLLKSKVLTAGSIGGVLLGTGLTGATTVRKDVTDYIKDSGELISKLKAAGMDDMADELYQSNKDLKDGFDVIIPYLPWLGKNIEEKKILNYRDDLNAMNVKYEESVKADAKAKIAEKVAADQQEADVKRQQDLADLADKRAYDAATLTDKRAYDEAQAAQDAEAKTAATQEQRAYNEKQTQEQRTYNEEQSALAAQRASGMDATATETSQPSSLTFGLLSTSGAKEFVNADKAAQFYFGKSYTELTPEQQMLLNLLKGKGGD